MHTSYAVTVYFFSLFLFQEIFLFIPLVFRCRPWNPLRSAVIEVRRGYVSMATRYDSHPLYLFIYLPIHQCLHFFSPSVIFQNITGWVPEKEICYYRGSVISYCFCLFGCMSSVATATTHFSPWSAHRNHI